MNFLIITHIFHRKDKPVEGPFTSIGRALQNLDHNVVYIGLPLVGFDNPVHYQNKEIQIPAPLGKNLVVKYMLDAILIKLLTFHYLITNLDKKVILIGIDPLSTLPLIFFRYIFNMKLIFYSVDYSHTRFGKGLLQNTYAFANKICSKNVDQVWVVSESLQAFSDLEYGTKSIYIPNSFPFDDSYFEKNAAKRTGNKIVWTGSVSTEKQMHDIFLLSQKLQSLRPELEFWYIPSFQTREFTQALPAYNLTGAKVIDVPGQKESRDLVSLCDLGLAIYDRNFGSTEFIEPIKVWEYMMCGVSFILSCEASINKEIKKAGLVYVLGQDNKITNDKTATEYIDPANLIQKSNDCVKMAQQYDTKTTVSSALKLLPVD